MKHSEIALLVLLLGVLLFVIMNTFKSIGYESYVDTHRIFWPLDYQYGQSNMGKTCEYDNNVNTLFSAHPIKLTCAHKQEDIPKHVRLHSSGNPMYISHRQPNEDLGCKIVECPPLLNYGLNMREVDHYNPYPLKRDNITCWSCE